MNMENKRVIHRYEIIGDELSKDSLNKIFLEIGNLLIKNFGISLA